MFVTPASEYGSVRLTAAKEILLDYVPAALVTELGCEGLSGDRVSSLGNPACGDRQDVKEMRAR